MDGNADGVDMDRDNSGDTSSGSSTASSPGGYTLGEALQVITEVAADISVCLPDDTTQGWWSLVQREQELERALKALGLPPTLKELVQSAADRAGITDDPNIFQVLALLLHYLEIRGISYLRMVEPR